MHITDRRRVTGHVRRWLVVTVSLALPGCSAESGSKTVETNALHTASSAATTTTGPSIGLPVVSDEAASTTQTAVVTAEPWIAYEFVPGRTKDLHGIRLVHPDGKGDHWGLPQVPGGDQDHPDWSPDGHMIALTVNGVDIWIAEPDGSTARLLANCDAPCFYIDDPAWSHDGRSIAVVRVDAVDSIADGSQIQIIDVGSGETRTVLTTSGADYAAHPRWSPDNSSLVFDIVRYDQDNVDTQTTTGSVVATVRLDEPAPTANILTDWEILATYPDWHPTKDLIVFATRAWVRYDDGPSELYTIKPDGSALTKLTDRAADGYRAAQPSWTPDGERIMFLNVRGNQFGLPLIYTVASDGSDLQQGTSNSVIRASHPRLQPATGDQPR